MSAEFTQADLRRFADCLDGMTAVAVNTGVIVDGYSGDYLSLGDHKIRIRWDAGVKEYVATWPDGE